MNYICIKKGTRPDFVSSVELDKENGFFAITVQVLLKSILLHHKSIMEWIDYNIYYHDEK
jgi:hypothetical protein